MIDESPGLKLRQVRKAKGWTQEQLAEKLYVSRQTISNWENDRSRMDLSTLKQVGEVLEIDMASFLMNVTDPASENSLAAEASRLEEHTIKPSAPNAKRFRIIGISVLLVVLISMSLIMVFRNDKAPAAGSLYTKEWFAQDQSTSQESAYLHLYTRDPILQATRATPSSTPMWHYNVYLRETNGIGLTVESITFVTHKRDGSMIIDTRTDGAIMDLIGMCYIGANEYRWIYRSQPADSLTLGIGCVFEGIDNNQNEFCFRLFIPFENAYT